jgi:hypothetical protein
MTLLTFGTIWFWLLIFITAIYITGQTEEEDGFLANIALIGTCLLLYFFGNSEFFKSIGNYIIENPNKVFFILLGYLILGTIWSVFKWFFYLRVIRDENKGGKINLSRYTASTHKSMIIHWMLYFPLSATWTLINDPVKKLFELILENFGGIYDKMANKILGDLEDKK